MQYGIRDCCVEAHYCTSVFTVPFNRHQTKVVVHVQCELHQKQGGLCQALVQQDERVKTQRGLCDADVCVGQTAFLWSQVYTCDSGCPLIDRRYRHWRMGWPIYHAISNIIYVPQALSIRPVCQSRQTTVSSLYPSCILPLPCPLQITCYLLLIQHDLDLWHSNTANSWTWLYCKLTVTVT